MRIDLDRATTVRRLPDGLRRAGARVADALLGPEDDDDAEAPHPLDLPSDGRLLLGRSSVCDVRLAEPSVSRRHAELRREAGGWLLVDWASTNGTWVNGVRIERAHVRGGEVLRLGDARVLLRRR